MTGVGVTLMSELYIARIMLSFFSKIKESESWKNWFRENSKQYQNGCLAPKGAFKPKSIKRKKLQVWGQLNYLKVGITL